MNIVVYLASSIGTDPVFCSTAEELGAWIGEQGHTLVYGGSDLGTMGVLCDAALRRDAHVIGVMPEFMIHAGRHHKHLPELIQTKDMSTRRSRMIELGEAFIALPGGPGTLEEISEVISRVRLGLTKAPCILFNVNGFYDSLKRQIEDMIICGFAERNELENVHFVQTIQEIKELLAGEAERTVS